MQVKYNGYILEIEEEGTQYKLSCEKLWGCFSTVYYTSDYWNSNSEDIIEVFKQQVDNKM